jgi:DDE superfamily endonuclease
LIFKREEYTIISYHILDKCQSHLTAPVQVAFAACNTEVDLIPGGYTIRLQPMDVGVNKPVKGYVSDNLTYWLIGNRNKKTRRCWMGTQWMEDSDQTDGSILFLWSWL